MFWTALYVFPLIWVALLFVGILKLYEIASARWASADSFHVQQYLFPANRDACAHFQRNKYRNSLVETPSDRQADPAILQVGFTYADRDAKRKWATGMAASSMLSQFGGVGGSIVGGLRESTPSGCFFS